MLSDLEFAADNTMILAFRDRFGDQMGFDDRDPDDTELVRGDGFGDILRAQQTGPATWTVAAAEAADATEFFSDDDWTDTDFTHDETGFGGLALRVGSGEFIYTRTDPLDGPAVGENDFSGGVNWTSLATGATTDQYEVYDADTATVDIFGKGNGLGDVELICELPPLEIGNRVWCDDGDGVQDPGETGLAGVGVSLVCDTDGNGIVGGGADLDVTTTTDGVGEFLFNAANVTGGVPPRTLCQLQVERVTLNGTCGAIAAVTLVDASSGTSSDLRDSDASILFGDVAGVEFTTGGAGENDHTLDLGFTPSVGAPGSGGLDIVKTSSPSGPVSPGGTIDYTIEVTNNSTVTQTGIELFAEPPAGLTYVPGTTVVNGPRPFLALDRFETAAFSNQDGTNPWATDWIEVDGDGLGATAGNVQVTGGGLVLDDDPSTGEPGVQREVDLSGLGSATLEFTFETSADVDAGEAVTVDISSNGGGTFTTLEVLTGIAGASTQTRSFNIAPFISANTRVRFRITTGYGGANESMRIDNVRIQGAGGVAPQALRVTEYFVGVGDFSGAATTLDLTLNQNLVADYFVMVQGSDGQGTGGNNLGPDENFARLVADPFGTGDLATSAGANSIRLQRGNGVFNWVGVVTVVECLADCDVNGFRLRSVEEVVHTGASVTGTDTSATSWSDLGQVMLMGGYAGAGCQSANTDEDSHNECFTRLVPSGSNTIGWSRDNTGAVGFGESTSTVMVLEWGSTWNVERVRVQGTVGGAGADATGEYATAAIGSVVRDNTWVWGTGFTNDNGIGDSSEGVLITLGDGVNQNPTETSVAVGLEFSQALDFEVYALSHPNLAVDYRFKADGNTNDLVVDVTVDSATSATGRMALSTNGQGGAGDAFPRPFFSARYLNNTTVRLERRRSGQPFPAWVQGIDFSAVVGAATGSIAVTVDNAGGLNPQLVNGTPVDLIEPADGFQLEPGESLTVTFQVTVDSPVTLGTVGFTCPSTVDSLEGPPASDSAFNLVGQPGIIGDFVWFDVDSDGVQDPGEPGIPGARVVLHEGSSCASPVLETAVTDADGFYLFDDLPAGPYCVEVYEETLPTGYTLTTANNPTTLTLASGATDDTVDFGYSADQCLPEIGFERDSLGNPMFAGQIVDTEFSSWGVTISATGGSNELMVFNSRSPTGGDADLGTPNESFGGPGIGAAGVAGQPNENRFDRGNVGVISEDGDSTDPDDNAGGGTIIFEFDRDVEFDLIGFVDSGDTAGVDTGEIRLFDVGGTQIGTGIAVPGSGDNGVNVVSSIGGLGVRRVELEFFGSGSVDIVRTCPIVPVTGRLGDRVWLDIDGDGLQDVGEPGLANVQVTLFDAGPDGVVGGGDDIAIDGTLTDAFGLYLFTDLPPGNFYVDVTDATVPTGLTLSPGSVDPAPIVALPAGGTDLDSDFGYTNAAATTAVVGDTVWIDDDSDGLQDPGEQGAAGVTLELRSPGTDGVLGTVDDVVEATTTTNADGRYLFTGVAPGDYAVAVTDTGGVLTGFTQTTGPQSSTNPSTPFTVAGGDVYLLADFGFDRAGLFAIDDVVWYDADGDGVLDPGEQGLGGVTVDLLDSDGNVVASQTTAADGTFRFGGLENGDYTLRITDTGSELAGLDSTTFPASVRELDVTLAGADVSGINFGYNQDGVYGDTVFSDSDGDGVQDPGELGIAGVTVQLFFDVNANGVLEIGTDTLIDTAVTDATGGYLFEGLFPGIYFGSVDDTQGALTGYTGTTVDDEVAAGDQIQGAVPAGTSFLLGDFGYQNTALPNISGNVFEDFDRDGIDDGAIDPGIGGVTLALLDASGTVIATTTTAPNGDYSFNDLPAGDYTVTVTDDAGVLDDFELTSNLDAIDVTVVASDITGIDFGYARDSSTAAIGDFVWLDGNGDGIQGSAENGIAGVTVTLFDPGPDGVVGTGDDVSLGTTVTDVSGRYLFPGLVAGQYYAEVDTTTLPNGGADLVSTTPNPSTLIDLSEGEVFLDADFGFASGPGVGAIGDFVWFDADADGIQDPGEPGIGGVQIVLTGPGCAPCTAVTDADGSYLFTGLMPGNFSVDFNPATVPPTYGTMATNTTGPWSVVLVAGEIVASADFGLPAGTGLSGSIGDRVWFDTDADGVQDAGEPGLSGVTINLLDAAGTTLLASTVTGADGAYDFTGLPAGTYVVDVTDVNGVLTTLNLTGGADPTAPIVLAAGQDFDLADFGYAPSGGAGTIGTHIWRDLDDDGLREAGEPGFERVTVELWVDVNGNGVIEPGTDNLVRTEVTDGEGFYEFRGLPEGDYLVRPTDANGVLAGFTKTSGTAGVDENSQAVPYPVTLSAASPNNLTADFGYSAADDLTIAGTTFFDVAGNGVLEPVDARVSVVQVLLFRDLDGDGVLDGDDALIDFQLSDGMGDYLFTDLPPGDYIVAVDATGTFVDGGIQTTQLLTSSVEPVTLVAVNSVDNDFGFTRPATLALVGDVEVVASADGLVLIFETSSEAGTAGFRVLRDLDGRWTPVSAEPLLAPFGAPQGSVYRLVDGFGGAPGDAVSYLLLEEQRVGPPLEHGPYKLTVIERPLLKSMDAGGFDAEPRPARASWLARAETYRQTGAQLASVRKNAGAAQKVKLLVRQDGLQRVSLGDLAAAFGASEADLGSQLQRGDLRLRRGSATVAYRVAGGALEFIGRSIDSLYTLDEVYWLEPGAGELMGARANGPASPASGQSFGEVRSVEEDVFAGTFVARDPELDYWHWRGLVAGNAGFGSFGFDLDLPGLDAAEDSTLTVNFRGASETLVPLEHHAEIEIGGVLLGETFFDDLDDHSVTLDVPAGLLNAGVNTVTVRALLDTGAASGFFYVDSFEVAYRRALRAEQDRLEGGFEGRSEVSVEGFGTAAIQVFDVTDPDRPTVITDALIDSAADGSWRASFARAAGGEAFLASSAAAAFAPEIVVDSPSDLRSADNEGFYLVLATEELRAPAQRLADLRGAERSGLVVLLEDVMDEFSDGVFDPRAVRDFLAHALSTWAEPPHYLVLAGTGHFDYRDLLGTGANPMPPLLVGTPFGLYSSDGAFSDLDGDRVPDLRTGRIPVLSAAELDAYVSKVEAYEASEGSWSERVLLLTDNVDAGGNFPDNTSRVAAALPDEVRSESISLDELTLSTARQRLFEALEEGVGLVNWVGHGGLDRLADEGFLVSSDVPGLGDPSTLPIVATLSCNIARFELPGFDALSEDLVLEPAGGAVAVWAPSGEAMDFDSHRADLILAEEAFSPLNRTLGDIIQSVLVRFGDTAVLPYSVQIYNLIGDPALVPRLPVTDIGRPVVDVALDLRVAPTAEDPENSLTFGLTVSNDGPNTAREIAVSSPSPASLESCQWTCDAPRGTACDLSGSRFSLQAVVDLPALTAVEITGVCRLASEFEGMVARSARAELPAPSEDLDLLNNQATAEIEVGGLPALIFEGDFESGTTRRWSLTVGD
ncbi:MAG: SdrD B-like domain-containing protein [Acidobacteriota bacterium]